MKTIEADEQDKLLETAKVIKSDAQYIWVEIERKSVCGGCKSSEGCGTGSLSKIFSGRQTSILKIPNTLPVDVGQRVVLQLGKNDFVKQIFIAYGLPLIGFFMGALIAPWIVQNFTGGSTNEISAIVGSIVGLMLGWLVAQKIYRPVLPQVVDSTTSRKSL